MHGLDRQFVAGTAISHIYDQGVDLIIASFPTVITCLQAVTSASFEFYTSLICDVHMYAIL